METNILGLPSLTGYTPLKAAQEGQVLKYDFREIGPIVIDKSGHGNLGRLKPVNDPPRRKIQSLFPLSVGMVFDGSNDHILARDRPSLDLTGGIKVEAEIVADRFTDFESVLVKGNGGNVKTNYRLMVEKGPEIRYKLIVDGERVERDVPAPMKVGKLHKIGWEYRAKGEIKVMLDGEVLTRDTVKSGSPDPNDLGLYIGAEPHEERTRCHFDGEIKRVSIARL